MRTKRAIIVASTVEVVCPWCGESQPNPDNGAFPWTPEEVKAEADKPARLCVSCECGFVIQAQSRVSIDPTVYPARP